MNQNNIRQQDVYQEIEGFRIIDQEEPAIEKRMLAKEHKMQIDVNEKPIYQVVCTPDDLEALVVGRLLTEGVIHTKEDIESLYICETGERAKVFLKNAMELEENTIQEVVTCCTDNKAFQKVGNREMEKVQSITWRNKDIFMLAAAMEQKMPLYDATHAVHSCFLAHAGKILFACEDIGRHNALDKVIGLAVMQRVPLEQSIIYTSGRVPTDMVSKVIQARIPVLISKGAPTMDAVDMARTYDLTLICHARGNGAVKYNGSFGEKND